MADPLETTEHGLTGNSEIPRADLIVITSFTTLALYNFLELAGSIFATFEERRGLYFWSMIVTTCGIVLNAIGLLIKFVTTNHSPVSACVYIILVLAGWWSMVTGHSVVLFSRLHLLVYDRFTIRFILFMIVFNAVLTHMPIMALFGLVNWTDPGPFTVPFYIMEKIQTVIFFVQEFIISATYIIRSVQFMRAQTKAASPGRAFPDLSQVRNVMSWLIGVSAAAILLNASMLALNLSGLYDLQSCWRPLVYSIKLKLEFAVLNRVPAVVGACNPDRVENQDIKLNTLHVEDGKHPRGQRTARNEHTLNQKNPAKEEDDDDDKDVILPVQSHFSDVSTCSAAMSSPSSRTKDRNSSRFPFH